MNCDEYIDFANKLISAETNLIDAKLMENVFSSDDDNENENPSKNTESFTEKEWEKFKKDMGLSGDDSSVGETYDDYDFFKRLKENN